MKPKLSHEEISGLCLELSLLLHAGVSLGDGLALLAGESDDHGRELLEAMARQVDEGSALSAAMKETGRFPAYVCGLIEVGEAAGRTRPCPLCPGTTRTGCGWTAACPRCGC